MFLLPFCIFSRQLQIHAHIGVYMFLLPFCIFSRQRGRKSNYVVFTTTLIE